MNCLLFIETRPLPNLWNIFNDHLGYFHVDDWHVKAVCSEENKHLFEGYDLEIVPAFRSITEYNYYVTSEEFWERFTQYDRVLFTEHESMILRDGVDDFLEWDYVGAPWPLGHCDRPDRKGGNGGFSLRNPKKCLELCKAVKYNPTMGNEDLFFVHRLDQVGGNIAPYEVCKKFSCETMFELGTVGYHAINKHLTLEQCNQIKNQYK